MKKFPPEIMETVHVYKDREPIKVFRDKEWRPLREEECKVENPEKGYGIDYFNAVGETEVVYYWNTDLSDSRNYFPT